MHTCDNCMFCHYRKLRIAAVGARDDHAPEQQPGAGPAQPAAPATAAQTRPPPRTLSTASKVARAADMV